MPTWYRPRLLRTDKKPLSETSVKRLAEFDRIADNPEEASKLSLRQLREPLQRIPKAERGVEWTERVVIAYCLKRERSPRVRSLKKSIMAYWVSVGEDQKARDFEVRVKSMLAYNGKNVDGYFLDFSVNDRSSTAEDLAGILRVLQNNGLKVFLNSGSLLGAVRDKSFLKHDDDIDIGVMMEATNAVDAAKELVALHRKLTRVIDLPIKTSFKSPVLKIKLPSDIVVDLFPTWIEDGRVYIWPHTFGDLAESDLLPFGTQTLAGVEFPAPANPEKMLALNYGEGWRAPDPHFRFPWAEAREKFKVLLDAYWYAVRKYTAKKKIFG